MWVERKQSWIKTVVLGGSALPHIWLRVFAVTTIALMVTFVYMRVPALHYSISSTPFVLIGLPLGIFIGFRNNSAYDRFWEGRKAWGSLVNTSRSVTRQVLTLLEPMAESRQSLATDPQEASRLRAAEAAMVHLVIAFVHALRHHLRDSDPSSDLARVLGGRGAEGFRDEGNVPVAILQRLGDHVTEARHAGWIHPLHVQILETSLVSLTDVLGICERIKSTPIPYSYTVLIHRIVAVYCGFLPFGLAESIGWATPVVVLGVSYALFGLDAVGDELEQPFGLDTNDLALESISWNIERDLRKRLGEPVPDRIQPVRGVLR